MGKAVSAAGLRGSAEFVKGIAEPVVTRATRVKERRHRTPNRLGLIAESSKFRTKCAADDGFTNPIYVFGFVRGEWLEDVR